MSWLAWLGWLTLAVTVPILAVHFLIPRLCLRLIHIQRTYALRNTSSNSDSDWIRQFQPWSARGCVASLSVDVARSVRWSWSMKRALKEFHLTLYQPSIQISLTANDSLHSYPNTSTISLSKPRSRMLTRLVPSLLAILQWLRIHITLIDARCSITAPTSRFTATLGRIRLHSACSEPVSDNANDRQLWSMELKVSDAQLFVSTASSVSDDKALLSMQPLDVRFSIPLIRPSLSLPALPSTAESQLEVNWSELRASIDAEQAMVVASLASLTIDAIRASKFNRSHSESVIVSEPPPSEWFAPFLRVPSLVDIKLAAFDVSLTPATLSSTSSLSKRHTLTALQLTFSTFECYYWREWLQQEHSDPHYVPASLPIRATLVASELFATTHLPHSPSLEFAPSVDNPVEALSVSKQRSQSSPQSSRLPTVPFHLLELIHIGIEAHLDLTSLFSVRDSQLANEADNSLELSISTVHLSAHPVIAQWTELLIATFPSLVSGRKASPVTDTPSPRPSRPFFSLDSPLVVPSLPLRMLLEAEHVSMGVYRQDGSPSIFVPISILLISASSSYQQSRYEAVARAQSISLHCYEPSHAIDQSHDARHCVIGVTSGTVSLSIVNAHNNPTNPNTVSSLELSVQPRCEHLEVRYSTHAFTNLISMVDEFVSPHHRLVALIEHRRQRRSAASALLVQSASQPKLPVIVTVSTSLKTARMTLPTDTEDGYHAVSLSLQRFDARHCFDVRNPRTMLVDRPNSEASLDTANLTLHSPYAKQSNGIIDCVALGRVDVTGLPRSSINPLDSVAVRINGAGLRWSLVTQMAWFHLKQTLRFDRRSFQQHTLLQSLLSAMRSSSPSASGFASPRSNPRSRSSSSSLCTIVLVHVEHFALELSFTEYQRSLDTATLEPHTSLMTFFTSRLKFSSPCAHYLPKSMLHPDCKYSLPVTVAHGWWAVDGVPLLHWDHARLGGGRGTSGLPDIAGEMTRGIFRLVHGFNFGAAIQSMIDRWKAFRHWRKWQRALIAARMGVEADSEEEKHRAKSPHFPYASDFGLGCIHIRLTQCKFELSDSPASVAALSARRASLSADHTIAEADLRRLGSWRVSVLTDMHDGASSNGSRSGTFVSLPHRRSSTNRSDGVGTGLDFSSQSAKPALAKSRSLNFDDDRTSAQQEQPKRKQTNAQQPASQSSSLNLDASNSIPLIQSVLMRAHGSTVLSFPPVSQYPVTPALFTIASPDVSFSVDYTESLQKLSYLYRKVRCLDPCHDPPYQAFIQAEDRVNMRASVSSEVAVMPDIANSFADLWGRHVILHGQRVEMLCRDHPLPLVRAKKLTFAGELILGQLRAPERWLAQQSTVLSDAQLTFSRNSAIPTKLYYDMQWDGVELDVNWGPALAPCLSAMAEAFNRLTPSATPRVGAPLAWWDDLRYKFHGRLLIVAHNTINVRILKSPSPYRANFLCISASSAHLMHSNGVFDGHAIDAAFDIASDEHEGIFDGRAPSPDYIKGRLIASPSLHARVELVWSVKPLSDGTPRHMFDHHLHHYHWNNPDRDCMDHFRARGLQYQCVKVRLEPHTRARHHNETTSSLNTNLETSPRQSSPRTLHHSSSFSTLPTATLNGHRCPHLSCRWYAYQYFWNLIAIFQDPPIILSPLATRTRPGLGEMFEHLSLSLLLIEPRIEVLDEDSSRLSMDGLNGLLVEASRLGVDWMWIANYGKDGTKTIESQDMAIDAHRLSMKVLAPNGRSDADDGIINTTAAHGALVLDDSVDDETHRIRAVQHQLDRRVEGEIVNFMDAEGRFHSPFDRPPLGYHVASILSIRLAAYRTYYKPQSSASAVTSPTNSGKVQPRLTQLEASSDLGRSDRPPFCMDVQVEGERPEWQSLFGTELAPNDESDPVNDIWKGPTQSHYDESIIASPPPSPSASSPIDDDNDDLANLDVDDEYQRLHTFSLSEFSEASNGIIASTDINRFVATLNEQSKATNTTSGKSHRRTRSDTRGLKLDGVTFSTSPVFITQTPTMLPAPTVTSSSIRSPSTTMSNSFSQYFYTSSRPVETGIDMTIGATRGRKLPATHLLDLSSTSHNFVCANLKLLCTKSMKRAWLTWKSILSRPYHPPVFVAESQAAATAYYEAQRYERAEASPSLSVPPHVLQGSLSVIQEFETPMNHSRSPSLKIPSSIDFDYMDPHLVHRSVKDEMMELVYEVDPSARPNTATTTSAINYTNASVNTDLDSSRLKHRQIHRWAELSNWFSLYSVDFIRPQVTFQSAATNSRFVLAAARARLESQGLPIALKRDRSSEPITLLPSAEYHLESYVYFARKHVATLNDAQAFVCPVDIDGETARVQWAKDTAIMKEVKASHTDANRLSAGLPDNGVLRKIVEPCTLHFTMTGQCEIDAELKARGLVVTDEMNGIAVNQLSRALRKRLSQPSLSLPFSQSPARTLSQTIQLFIPTFHAHLDSNEYFTLQSVVEDLFLTDFLTSTAVTPAKVETRPPLPQDKFEAAALIERALQKDVSEVNAATGTIAIKCQKRVKRLVQYYLGRSAWALKSNNVPFIAAHVNGLYGNHTFFHDNSSDTEFSLHFLTLQSKSLPPTDPRANLLIPDPDHWLRRDSKRDQMIAVRAKVHAPLTDSQVHHVTVYELFEVTIFPQVINGSYDDYIALKAYFFPVLTTVDQSRNDRDKEQAAKNFFRLSALKSPKVNAARMGAGAGGVPNNASSSMIGVTNVTSPLSSHSQSAVAPLPLPSRVPPLSSPLLSMQPPSDDNKMPEPVWITSTSSGSAHIHASPSRDHDMEVSRQSTVKTLISHTNVSHIHHRASPVRSNKKSKGVRKRNISMTNEPHQRYFRYLRVNGVTFLASFRRPHSIWNCENVSVTIAPLIKNQRCWTWDKFYSKLESHLAWSFAHQIPQILARMMGVKGERGKEVQSLSQRFIDAQIQENETTHAEPDDGHSKKQEFDDERKMLGFPARASAGSTGDDAKHDGSEPIAATPLNSARQFFKMPSMPAMPTMHMPQLSFDGMEELAQKAVLLFGSKKEKIRAEKEKRRKEKEKRRDEEKKAREQLAAMATTLAFHHHPHHVPPLPAVVHWHGISVSSPSQSSSRSSGSSTPIFGVTFTHAFSPSNAQAMPLSFPDSAPPQPVRPPIPSRPPLHTRAASLGQSMLNPNGASALKRTDPAMLALLNKHKKPLPKAPVKSSPTHSPPPGLLSLSSADAPLPLASPLSALLLSPPPSLPRRPTRYDFNIHNLAVPPAPPVLDPQLRSTLRQHARSLSAGPTSTSSAS